MKKAQNYSQLLFKVNNQNFSRFLTDLMFSLFLFQCKCTSPSVGCVCLYRQLRFDSCLKISQSGSCLLHDVVLVGEASRAIQRPQFLNRACVLFQMSVRYSYYSSHKHSATTIFCSYMCLYSFCKLVFEICMNMLGCIDFCRMKEVAPQTVGL